jgi:hypothetical protein
MMEQPDLQPEIDEVLQSESYVETAVKVCVESVLTPVRTQDLPRKGGSTRTYTVSAITPQQILQADHFRAKATIMSIGQNMLIGFGPGSAGDPSTMCLWPANVPFIVTAAVDIFVLSATATTTISFASELWAMGD